MLRTTIALTGIVGLLAACGDDGGTTAGEGSSGTSVPGREAALVTCGESPFPLEALLDPQPSESADDGAAWRQAIADVNAEWAASAGGELYPSEGWIVLRATGDETSLMAVTDTDVHQIELVRRDGGWTVESGWSDVDCELRTELPAGQGTVTWRTDPAEPPTPESTTIAVLAREQTCAGGRAMDDRLIGPIVVETADELRISFAAVTLPGEQSCPGNPETAVVVELSAPLGGRPLRDGAVLDVGVRDVLGS